MNTLAVAILACVTAQRASEVWLARRNTERLLATGGVEHGANHYPVMVALHAAWLLILWWLAPVREVSLPLLALYAACQVLRLWILATLGARWTTRIITVPGERLVARGPFRFIRHPNYALVAIEVPLLPLVFNLMAVAAIFAVLNLAMLAWRIGVENRALGYARS